jgi:hypothetical protein
MEKVTKYSIPSQSNSTSGKGASRELALFDAKSYFYVL